MPEQSLETPTRIRQDGGQGGAATLRSRVARLTVILLVADFDLERLAYKQKGGWGQAPTRPSCRIRVIRVPSRCNPRLARDVIRVRSALRTGSGLQLQGAHVLRAGGGSEPAVLRRQPRRVDRAIRRELRIPDGQVGRAVELIWFWRLMITTLNALNTSSRNWQLTAAADPNVTHQRQVDGLVGAAAHDVAARLQTQAAVAGSSHRRAR